MAHTGERVFAMALVSLTVAQPEYGGDNNNKGKEQCCCKGDHKLPGKHG